MATHAGVLWRVGRGRTAPLGVLWPVARDVEGEHLRVPPPPFQIRKLFHFEVFEAWSGAAETLRRESRDVEGEHFPKGSPLTKLGSFDILKRLQELLKSLR